MGFGNLLKRIGQRSISILSETYSTAEKGSYVIVKFIFFAVTDLNQFPNLKQISNIFRQIF